MQTSDRQDMQEAAHSLSNAEVTVNYFDASGERIKPTSEIRDGKRVDTTEIPEGGEADLQLGPGSRYTGVCALIVDPGNGGRDSLTKLGIRNLPTTPAIVGKRSEIYLFLYKSERKFEDNVYASASISVKRELGPGAGIVEKGTVPIPPTDNSYWVTKGTGLAWLPEALQTVEALPSNEESHSNGPFQRTDARKLISEGIKSPEPIGDFPTLYSGKVHALQAESHVGKTYAAYKHIINMARSGKSVVIMEYENGEEDAINQLRALGANEEDFDRIHIFDSPTCSLNAAENFRNLIDVIRPALVVWDNLASALSVAGLNEDLNKDCSDWHNAYTKPLRKKGVATLILDHVVKAEDRRGRHAKGAVAKFNECDVIWNLSQPERFTPKKTGKIRLKLEKAKSGLTPPETLDFEAGGPDAVFNPARRQADLGDTQKKMFGALEDGMDWEEWKAAAKEAGVSRQRFTETRDALIDKDVVWAGDDAYYAA